MTNGDDDRYRGDETLPGDQPFPGEEPVDEAEPDLARNPWVWVGAAAALAVVALVVGLFFWQAEPTLSGTVASGETTTPTTTTTTEETTTTETTTTTEETTTTTETQEPDPPEITSFELASDGIPCGPPVPEEGEEWYVFTATWESADADSATLKVGDDEAEDVPASGETEKCALNDSPFRLEVTGPGGTDTETKSMRFAR